MTTTTNSSPEQPKPPYVAATEAFFERNGLLKNLPEASETRDLYSQLIRSLLKVDRIDRGRLTCSLVVNPSTLNAYGTLHGGMVAAVAEAVGVAVAKTVVAGEKELFLGESSTSYLSAAMLDDVVEVDGSILRQGRSVLVTSMEFRMKNTGKLLYTSRATFYVMPVASL